MEGHVDIMELLVKRGADVDITVSREDVQPKGWRALFATITHEKVCDEECVQILPNMQRKDPDISCLWWVLYTRLYT